MSKFSKYSFFFINIYIYKTKIKNSGVNIFVNFVKSLPTLKSLQFLFRMYFENFDTTSVNGWVKFKDKYTKL
jgi:hypothetical protein